MNETIHQATMVLLLFALASCGHSDSGQQDDLKKKMRSEMESPRKEPAVVQQKITTEDALKLAEEQFERYLPKILASHEADIDLQEAHTGDFTGDGIDDVAIYFSLTPKGGGNAIVGQGLGLYENLGNSVKVIGGYEPDYLFRFDRIRGGDIYVEQLDYAEEDGRCCPSIRTEHKLTISGSDIY